jgi:hypothetical protein
MEDTGSGRITVVRTQDRKRRSAFITDIKRDNRVTGLRDHRAHRATAKRALRGGEEIKGGKARRYGDFYDAYRW